MIAKDKQLHLLAGVVVATIAQALCIGFVGGPFPMVGVGAAALAGAYKEARDWYANRKDAMKGAAVPPHSVEWADFGFTTVGGVVVDVLAVGGLYAGVLP